jgi:hypothetical protein
MAVDKIVPKYLNKEDDVRLVKNIEMTDALNVRISAEMNGDGGVIKNAYGNEAVSFAAGVNWQDKTHALPSGTNKVIGSVADLKDGIVIFFVWNANGDHSIYRFSTASDVAELVYRDSVLEFQADSFVKGDVIRNLSQDSLLYFTDGISSPKKINVSRAIRGGYSSVLSNGTDSEKLEFITLAKKPPLDPPTFSFFTDTTVQENNIYENTYQFAYRYVYLDGEVSAISKYSELAVSQQQLRDGLITDEQKLENNAIRVAVTTSVADVRRIEVLARNGNTGAWFIISEISNPSLSSEATLYTDFKNDQLYRFISTTDSDKLYDAVPLTAQSQTISGSRLFLGNYTEGYANQRNDIALWPNYNIRPSVQNIGAASGTLNSTIKRLEFDLSSVSTTASESLLNIDVSFSFGKLQLYARGYFMHWVELDDDLNQINAGGLIEDYILINGLPLNVSETVTIPSGSTKQNIADAIANALSKTYNFTIDSPVSSTDDYSVRLTDEKFGALNQFGTHVIARWLFFSGIGTVSISSAGFNPTTNKLTLELNLNSSTLNIKAIRKGTLADGLPSNDNIDFNKEVNFATQTPLLYTGDSTSFTYYSATDYVYGDIAPDYNTANPNGTFSSKSLSASVLYSSTFVSGSINGYKGFKSGASHNLGIVYYDDRNRASGVQKAGKVYLDWYGDRANKGVGNIVMRIANSAPSWARRWSPVYVKQSSVQSFLEYTVIDGYYATNVEAINSNSGTSNNDVFYLSMRSLEGKDDSYKESKGANLEYAYSKGDRLRVVSYGGSTFPVDVDFEIVDYKYFDDNVTTNPILNSTNDDTTYSTTGWFLVVKDKSISGWGKESIISNTDNWDDKCVIEIYRKRKEATEEVYYEIGRSYDVNVNGVMAGDRTSIPTYSIRCEVERPLQFRSDYIMYAGDIMSDGSGNSFIVTNVHASTSGSYNYYIYANLLSGSFVAASTYTVNIQNSTDCVVQLDEGDVYFRLRQLRYGYNPKTFNYLVRYVESGAVSDFFTSNNTSIGRPFTVLPDAKTVYRTGSVTYSDPFLIDVQTNGLSSFNPTLANFYDLNYVHGSVRYMHNRDDSVVFLQDKKCGVFPVNRNLVEYADGTQSLTVSTSVVGTPQYYQGEFGVNNNPESVAVESGRIYFADIRNGKVVRISRDGITPISEQGMDSYFKGLFSDIVEVASVKRVVGGVDEEAGEYLVSGSPVYTSTITINGDGLAVGTAFQERVLDDGGTFEGLACFASAANVLFQNPVATYTLQVASDGSVIYGGVDYDDDIIFKADTEYRNFNDICDTFDDSINAVIFLDRLADGQPIIIGEEYIGTTPTTLYGVATNSTYDFFVMVTIDVARGTFVFDNSCGDYDGTIGSASQTLESFTVGYDTDNSVWNTRYSYIPENITCIDDTLYTFYNGSMYKHYSGASRSTYYGSQDGSVVEVIAAFNPSMVKTYESISLEGTASWDTTITNTDQSAVIADTDYDQRERNWYAYVPRDSSANTGTTTITALSGSSEVFALGAVDSVSGSDIVFTSDISYITFPIGASLYKVSGSTLVSITNTISSVSNETTITCGSAVAGVIAGDEIVAIANGAIEGDQMRDYYAQIRLTNDSQTEIELYAINAVFAKSNLANQLGQ